MQLTFDYLDVLLVRSLLYTHSRKGAEVDKAELREVLDKALGMDRKFFRSFSLWDWLGLSCFSDDEIEKLEESWLAFDDEDGSNPDFGTWLSSHDSVAYQKYKQQRDSAQQGLESYTDFFNHPCIACLRRARRQLDD